MKVKPEKGKLVVSLDCTEADMMLLMLRYAAYGSQLTSEECQRHFAADQEAVQKFYDELRLKYP